jgi:hypothetical protein
VRNGHQRAIRELERLNAAGGAAFELIHEPKIIGNNLVATIGIQIGAIETKAGGLDLREREEFVLIVPPEFPFEKPSLYVEHNRFAGFPHVTWVHWLCLYQSNIEWNPSAGLYGFFNRLKLWLGKAAIHDMDPIEGPLEPPHHNTDFSQKPFVVSADAPCAAGESWIGLARLEKFPNRIELNDWVDLSGEWPKQGELAFTVILPESLPMEFPSKGQDLFREMEKAGMDRERIIRNLALAALLSSEGEPMHFVLGLPMRRAKDGSRRIHIAVWTADAQTADTLKRVLPQDTDTDEIRKLRSEFSNSILSIFEGCNIKWTKVLEERVEIVVRRDDGTPISWFAGKKILVLGCGALGSWTSEIIARAKPRMIHLVDNADAIVKPGILARQNFERSDIGDTKANALARRLAAITHGCTIVPNNCEGHAFILEDKERLRNYDVVIDCTASSVLQMKLERDWNEFAGQTPLFVSLVIDSQAKHCLCVALPKDSDGGVWDAYLSLKNLLCIDGSRLDVIKAFYSDKATEKLFQPEPGCSDPTFIGSTADVLGLSSNALNAAFKNLPGSMGIGIALSSPATNGPACLLDLKKLPHFINTVAGKYKIRIAASIFTQASGWVKQNNRRRRPDYETGGLLWGFWDDAVQTVWIFDLSGPPPDSQHEPAHFVCGIKGTAEEHKLRMARTYGACGFVGHWHTHPDLPSQQSGTDIGTMATLVSSVGQNQKRSIMLIFGRIHGNATAGIYIYESESLIGNGDVVSVGMSQMNLEKPVV